MNPKDLAKVYNGKLLFGGFHVNGEHFVELDENE
jgi:hypothetical protein